jgi:hypothetical protein
MIFLDIQSCLNRFYCSGIENRFTSATRITNYALYSVGLGFPNHIRLAYFAPAEFMEKLDGIVLELNCAADPKDALNYYVRYAGFQDVFRIPVKPTSLSQMRSLARVFGHMLSVRMEMVLLILF